MIQFGLIDRPDVNDPSLVNVVILKAFDFKTSQNEGIVPAGFVSDGESVPRLLRPFVPRLGNTFKASIIHDYLIDDAGRLNQAANDAMADVMKQSGVPWLKRWAVFLGVSALYQWESRFGDVSRKPRAAYVLPEGLRD